MGIVKVAGPPKDPTPWAAAAGYVFSIMKGMGLTMRIFLRQLFFLEKSETLEWPEAPATYGPRFKGKHVLTKRPDGTVRCTACFLCATACPADCIEIEAAESPDGSVEKYPKKFEIDLLRCVFCGFCEEACPLDAIRLGSEYAMAGNREDLWVVDRDQLSSRKALGEGVASRKGKNRKHPDVYEGTKRGRKHSLTEVH